MDEQPEHPKPVRTLRQHLWQGFTAAHRRRPASFYMLLSIPVVLVLALNLLQSRTDPWRFAFGLSVLFVFLGIVLIRAVRDILHLTREHLTSSKRNYRETLGDEAFLETLREQQQRGEGERRQEEP